MQEVIAKILFPTAVFMITCRNYSLM